ncbi:MAG: phage tail tape measure protein [Candidatus Sedimenticola sp. 6PFRAG7]
MSKSLSLSLIVGAALGNSFLSTFKTAKTHINELGAAVDQAQLGKTLTGDILKFQRQLKILRTQQKRTGDSSGDLAREISRVESQLANATRRASKHGIEIGNITRQHKLFNKTLDNGGERLARYNRRQARQQKRQELHGRILPVVGATYAAGNVLGGAMGLEEKAVRLRTVINVDDGDTAAALQRSREHARRVARDSLASEAELLDIEYALNSAGLTEEAARVGSVITSKVATVTSGAPEQVGEIIGTTFNNMGAAIEGASVEEKMARIGDVLTKTQLKYQIRDFGQLGESMKYAAASAKMNNVSLEQTSVTLGMLNSAGLQGSMAGTAFSATLRQMGKASEKLGFNIVRDEFGNMDFAATLEELKMALSVYDDIDERNQVIQKRFGDEGARGLIPLLDGLDKFRDGMQTMDDASGVVDENYALFKESAAGQWKMFRQNIGMVGDTLAGTLLPSINAILTPLGQAAGGIGGMIEQFPILGHVIGGVAVGFAGFMAAAFVTQYVGTLVGDAWDMAKGVFKGFGKVTQWAMTRLVAFNATALITSVRAKALAVGGAIRGFAGTLIGLAGKAIPMVIGGLRALTLALMTNPVGLVIGGIAIAAGLIITYWEPIKEFFSGLWDGVKSLFGEAWKWIKATLSFSPLALITGSWGGVSDFFTNLWSGILDQAKTALDWLVGKFDAVAGFIGDAWDTVTGWFDDDGKENAKPGRSLLNFSTPDLKPVALAAAVTATPVAAEPPDIDQQLLAQRSAAPAIAGDSIQPSLQQIDQSTHTYQLTIQQLPGEDLQALAERIMREIDRRRQQSQREALHDEL